MQRNEEKATQTAENQQDTVELPSQQHTDENKQWVARIPRRVVIHRMETSDCLESRVFWAIVLWTLCGPQRSTALVIKDHKGFIQKDAAGNPVYAKEQDLLGVLGLAPGMKGHLSRTMKRLKEKGSIRHHKKVWYFVEAPPLPESPKSVASTGNWNIAGVVVSTGNLPTDPVARAEAIRWLDSLSTEWKTTLRTVKTGIRKLLVQGSPEHGIIIDKKRQKRRGETAAAESPDEPPVAPAAAAEPPPKAEPPKDLGEVEQVREALEPYGSADLETARRIIRESRKHYPPATPVEIIQVIHEKDKAARKAENPIGFLVVVVPKGFEGYQRKPPPTYCPPEPVGSASSDEEYESLLRKIGIDRSDPDG